MGRDVPDSDTRSRLNCAPTVTPFKVPLRNQIVVQRRKPRACLLSCWTRRAPPVTWCACMPDRRDFEPCCPVLRRYFGEVRPVATTIEAGLIDRRANIKIELSA